MRMLNASDQPAEARRNRHGFSRRTANNDRQNLLPGFAVFRKFIVIFVTDNFMTMETKDIRLALERLQRMADRSDEAGWPSAIERDLMLAELRQIYDTLLFATPQECPVQAKVQVPEQVQEQVQEQEQPRTAAPADVTLTAAGVATAADEPEQNTEDCAAAESTAEGTAESKTEGAPANAAETAGGSNLLFDLGAIQHRPHRRMMSLYDDDAFDRLPDTTAAAAQTAVPEPVAVVEAADSAEPAPEEPAAMQPAEESVVAAAAGEENLAAESATVESAAVESAVAEPAAEEPAAEEAVADEEPDIFDEEIVWTASDEEADDEPFAAEDVPAGEPSDSDADFAPEPEPEPEPKAADSQSEYQPVQEVATATPRAVRSEDAVAPQLVRRVADLYAEPMDAPAPAAAAQQQQQPSATVLGDVMNSGVEVLGDTLAPATSLGDTLAHAPVTSGLASAIDISERYQIIAELFDGDADACDAALERLDAMPSLEDAVIYIEENYRWNPSSPATALMMDLLDRKFS